MKRALNRAALAVALLLLAINTASAGETPGGDKRVAASSPGSAYDVVIRGNDQQKPNSFMIRDIFVMGGENLDKWPYIEHSDSERSGYIQGMNLVIPDSSRWGWRFITRVSEVPYNATIRATIDANGNGIFTGTVSAPRLLAGAAGSYSPAALVWGNRLGGDQSSTLFSSDTKTVQGVAATVFGVSYAGNAAVLSQDAFGNLGVAGDATAHDLNAKAAVTATMVKINDVAITAGTGPPMGGCSAGDLYLRKGGGGSTAFTCAQDNTWVALSTTAPVHASANLPALNPLVARASFEERTLDASTAATSLATVRAKLGASNGGAKLWYVCALVEANSLQQTHAPAGSMIDVGIATTNLGTGTPFRMYSRPDNDTNKTALGSAIVSDWLAQPTGTATGRYCNSYPNGTDVSFTAYALPPSNAGPIYTSGQIEIQALPQ